MRKKGVPVFLLATALFLLASCNQQQAGGSGGDGSLGSTTTIGGTIVNWPAGQTATLKATVYVSSSGSQQEVASTSIGSDGSFTLTLPSLAESILSPIDFVGGNSACSMTNYNSSNPNAKVAGVLLSVFQGSTPAGYIAYSTAKRASGPLVGDKDAAFTYSSADVNVTGSVNCTLTDDTGKDISSTLNINISLKHGWNTIIIEAKEVTQAQYDIDGDGIIDVAYNVPTKISMYTAAPGTEFKWWFSDRPGSVLSVQLDNPSIPPSLH